MVRRFVVVTRTADGDAGPWQDDRDVHRVAPQIVIAGPRWQDDRRRTVDNPPLPARAVAEPRTAHTGIGLAGTRGCRGEVRRAQRRRLVDSRAFDQNSTEYGLAQHFVLAEDRQVPGAVCPRHEVRAIDTLVHGVVALEELADVLHGPRVRRSVRWTRRDRQRTDAHRDRDRQQSDEPSAYSRTRAQDVLPGTRADGHPRGPP